MSDLVHTAQHLSFFASTLIFWWTVLPASGADRHGVAVISIFTTAVHSSILEGLLTFGPHTWYAAYVPTTAAWGLRAIADQQLGGLIMWVPAGLVYMIVGLVQTARHLRDSEAHGRSERQFA